MKKELFVLLFALVFMVSMGAVSATNSTCEVGIRVNYEYPDEINATIQELTDSSGQKIEFQKYFDPAANITKITFQHPQPETKFNITIAPRYQTKTQQFTPTTLLV
ncbi:MAG: hypothetical protein PWQ74_852 [Methanobacteriaceae archaeon]|nr:hypothetical protein [Methanobacteriaceae archaeon]